MKSNDHPSDDPIAFTDRSLPNFNNTRSSTNPELPSVSQTVAYRSAQNNNSRFVDDSYMDLSSTAPARPNAGSYSNPWNVQPPRRFTSNTQSSVFGSNPFATNNSRAEAEAQQLSAPETSPRRNYVTSMTAARSLEGDDRPIFGASVGGGRGRGRLPAIGTIPKKDLLRIICNDVEHSYLMNLVYPIFPNPVLKNLVIK